MSLNLFTELQAKLRSDGLKLLLSQSPDKFFAISIRCKKASQSHFSYSCCWARSNSSSHTIYFIFNLLFCLYGIKFFHQNKWLDFSFPAARRGLICFLNVLTGRTFHLEHTQRPQGNRFNKNDKSQSIINK